ncbi:MAG: cation:proton antiporter, partial [Candidatus Hydrogenedentes bacterium]|nr:cation:proton antiporter [Candidatus Hydrogenedentota bacterium]
METNTHFLDAIVVIFGVAVVVAWLFRQVRAPSIIGFLITGMAIGPSGWRLVGSENVTQFSEIGLVLLLFTIGLELSPEPLVRSGVRLAMAALGQVGVTAGAAAGMLLATTALGVRASVLFGMAVALSSTAIALKQLSDRGETDSTNGTIITGVLLLQDVVVIVLLLFLSVAAPKAGLGWVRLAIHVLAGLAVLAAATGLARWLLPRALNQIVRHGGRELMTLFAVLMACGGAWGASAMGWSPALGACIAGLLLAGADQRHQLVAEITPFRDVFNALFFISLGMLVHLDVLFSHLPLMCALIAVTLLLKPLLTTGAVVAAGWPVRTGVHVGVGLCTVSEFGYVLIHQAGQQGLVPPDAMDLMVAYTVCTMIGGAILFPFAGPISHGASALLRGNAESGDEDRKKSAAFEDHVIIVGYGFTGSNLARMLASTHVPCCVIEMDPSRVASARHANVKVVVGDAVRMTILEHAGVDAARALVVAINDHEATRRIVAQSNARRPELYTLARTSFGRDIDALYEKGAKLVIPQDFETSIEIAAHILRQFGVPDNIVEAQIAAVRAGGYGMLRGKATDRAAHTELFKILERTATQTFYLAEQSFACGLSVAQLNLRALT